MDEPYRMSRAISFPCIALLFASLAVAVAANLLSAAIALGIAAVMVVVIGAVLGENTKAIGALLVIIGLFVILLLGGFDLEGWRSEMQKPSPHYLGRPPTPMR